MKRLLSLLSLAPLLLFTMGVGPCDSRQLGSVEGCTYHGQSHAVGSSWASPGASCNDCTCTNTGAVCSPTACPDAGASPDAAATCLDSHGNPIACPSDGGSADAAAPDAPGTCLDMNGTLVPCDGDAGAVSCMYGGVPHAAGATFPSADGCNTCSCDSSGMVACTTKACASDAGTGGAGGAGGATACAFDATYVYGWVGGLTAFTDMMTLAPASSYQIVRTSAPGTVNQDGLCAPPLPACGSGNGKSIDVPIIMNDIADPSVQLLLSLTTTKTITLGIDPRSMDGSIFSFRKDGGAGFLVGGSCLGNTTGCTEPPAAVLKLRDDLYALDQQERLDPACAGALSMGE